MTTRRSFIQNLFFSAISAGSNVFALLLLMYAAHVLSLPQMGVLGVAFAFAAIGEPLMDFGVHQASIRHIALDRSSAGNILANSLPMKAISGLAMLVVLSGIALWRYPDAAPAAILMLISAAIRSYLLTIRGVLQGLEQFGHDAAVMLADRVLLLAGGVLALWLGFGVNGVALSFVVSRGVAFAIALRLTRPHVGDLRIGFDYPLWRELRDQALPLGLFMMVLNVYNYVDVLLLAALATSESQVGLYHNAYRIYEALTMASAILVSVLTPRFAALWASDRHAHAQLARRGLAASVLLGVAISPIAWVLAPTVLSMIFGADYAQGMWALRILSLGLGLIFAIWVLHALAMSTFNSRLLITTTLVSLVANVGLNLLLIPRWQRDGAAAATVLSEAVGVAMLVW
ncbi:MAG: flippase, partial [Acidobacteria bacterium]|nr:flippase [Acidobacteriota bacterium]